MSTNNIDFSLKEDSLRFLHSYTVSQLRELRQYLELLDDVIQKSKDEEIAKLEETYSNLPDSQKEIFWQDNYPIHWEELFSFNLRSAFILQLCKVIEPYLSMLCRDVKEITTSKISVGDLKGGLYERNKKFLRAIGGFDKPNDRSWESIGDIYALRNTIAHHGGIVEGSNTEKRVMSLMNKVPGISIPSAGMLNIEKSFCEHSISTVQDFIDDLYEAATKLHKTKKP